MDLSLYFRLGSIAIGNAHFGQGSGGVLLDNVMCVGTEDNIAQCLSNGWYITHCQHKDDVSVLCSEGEYMSAEWEINSRLPSSKPILHISMFSAHT